MTILAIDASGEQCAVALGEGANAHDWVERSVLAGQRHSELLLPMIASLLAEYGTTLKALTGIAFGAGPGSFTGLRIACGVAQGLAFGAELPLVGVCTLEAMAQTARQQAGASRGSGKRIVAALDARMREVYVAAYEQQGDNMNWCEILAPVVVAPDVAPALAGNGWTGVGNGFVVYPALRARYGDALEGVNGNISPSASAIGVLSAPRFAAGLGVAARDAAPFYVRHKVALTSVERTQAAQA